jgi:hypothetical protein
MADIFDESGFPVGKAVSEMSGSELRERWEKDRETPIPIPRHVHKNFNDPALAHGTELLSNLCRHGKVWPHCSWCHSTETLREDQRQAQLDRIEGQQAVLASKLELVVSQLTLLMNEVFKRTEPQVQEPVNRFLRWVP